MEVKFFRTVLPDKFKFFQIFCASYEGVIKILDPDKIKSTFLKLMNLSMVGIYIFDINLENEFLMEISRKLPRRHYDFGITKDQGYLMYIVDGDSAESPTGKIEVIHYGAKAICKGF